MHSSAQRPRSRAKIFFNLAFLRGKIKKSFERSVEVWKDCMRFKKELTGEELPPAELLQAKRNRVRIKRDATREEFRRRALAGGNMWESLSYLLTLLESFDKNNPEMGTDSVAGQMHQKTV